MPIASRSAILFRPGPTNIALSAATIAADAAATTVVGALSTKGGTPPYTYTWLANSRFDVSAANVRRSASGSVTSGIFETVTILSTDSKSKTKSKSFQIAVTPAAGAYTGPLDLAPGAYALWGLQRATTAYVGNCCKLFSAGDAANFNVPFNSDGTPDTSGIAGAIGAAPWTIGTLYDQSGNGYDLTQATESKRPLFSLTGGPNAQPVMTFDGVDDFLAKVSAVAVQTAGTIVALVDKTANNGDYNVIFNSDTANFFAGVDPSNNFFWRASGTDNSIAETNATWYVLQFLATGAPGSGSGSIVINGVNTSTPGINGAGTIQTEISIGGRGAGQYPFDGKIGVVGIWPLDATAGMNALMHTFWGF